MQYRHQLTKVVAGKPADTNLAVSVFAIQHLSNHIVPAIGRDLLIPRREPNAFPGSEVELLCRISRLEISKLLRKRRRGILGLEEVALRLLFLR